MSDQEHIYMWFASAGNDSTEQFDGSTQYDEDTGAQVFWEDLIDPSLLWIDPKTDWTSQDYYNYDDLNRVEIDAKFVADVLSDYRGQTVTITVVTDRDMRRIEYYDSLNRIEGNIQTLADNFFEPNGWIEPKTDWQSGNRFDWRDARRLEHNLQLLYELLLKALDNLKYCGTFYAGEDGEIY